MNQYQIEKRYKHYYLLKQFLLDYNIYNKYEVENISQSRIFINFVGLHITNEDNFFGLQKIITNDKFLSVRKYLLYLKYDEKKETIKKSFYENKLRIQKNTSDNEYYRTITGRVDNMANIIFSEMFYQNLEPTQFPNVVKYNLYNSINFTKRNISINFILYTFNNSSEKNNFNVEIEIKKYKGIFVDEKTLNELSKIIYLINN